MKNNKIKEGLEAIDRIKLMMEYSLSKTYSENLLVLSEQKSDYMMDRQSNAIMNASGIRSDADYKAVNSMIDNVQHVKGQSISEMLSNAREFLFTPGGMTTQLVLSVAGSEIGLPVIFSVLDVAILINDFTIMINNWKSYEGDGGEKEWFMYHYDNTKGFSIVMEDIILILTGGIIKLVGKGAKSAYKLIKKIFVKPIAKTAEQALVKIVEKEKYIKKLPKVISDWAEKHVSSVKQGIELLKTPKLAAKSVIKQLPVAAGLGAANYALIKYIEKKSKEWTNKPLADSVLNDNSPELDVLKEGLSEDNPGLKINTLKVIKTKDGYFGKLIINGIPYIFDPNSNNYKVIPLNSISGNSSKNTITNYDSVWDYKKENGNYYTKRKNSEEWTLTNGKSKEAIKNKVFKDI